MTGNLMSNPKIVFLDAFTNNPGDISFQDISQQGQLFVYERTDRDEIALRANDADIVIVNKFEINKDTLAMMPKVKYIVVAATGYNNIDIQSVNDRSIQVSNVKGYSTSSVTQHVFSMIFAILNRVEYYNTEVKNGRWFRNPDFCFYDHPIHELKGMTLGIIGFGNIGSKVANVAKAFDMNVIVHTPNPSKVRLNDIQMVELEELFRLSDIISLHCPMTESNKEIINKAHLKIMKKNALLINTGRGGLVNEDDLFYALDHGLIAGAALDVVQKEPPHISNPLVNHPKCIVTPHIAWASVEARTTLLAGIAENIFAFRHGNWINKIY